MTDQSITQRIWTEIVRRPRLSALAALAAAFMAGAVVMLGLLESDRLRGRIASLLNTGSTPPPRTDTVSTEWAKLETALLTLERLDVELGRIDGNTLGGGIDEFDNNIIYVSGRGRIGTLDLQTGELVYTDLRVPMDREHLRAEVFDAQPEFNQNYFRVNDILVWPTGASTADLLVSHNIFREEDQAVCNVISRTNLQADQGGISISSDWEEIYRLDACVSLPDIEWRFAGHMAGGRMARMDDNTLLLSVGEFGYGEGVGIDGGQPERVAFDSGNQLGKILTIDLQTKGVSIYAGGMRNPQGLFVDRMGRVWQTEHGAQGGDEVNLVQKGGDHGWPYASLGTAYGSPRGQFRHIRTLGRHDGYVKPAYAFVPSSGPAQLIALRGEKAFEAWRDDLLVATLKFHTLYRMRLDGDSIIYAEPIELGLRLRDIVELQNGWIAILTDNQKLVLLRDTNAASGEPETFLTSGYDAISELEAQVLAGEDPNAWGLDLFRGQCASCHRLDGSWLSAPPLNGIFGDKIGRFDDYNYSPGLLEKTGKWNRKTLDAFLTDPQAFAPGSTMPGIPWNNEYERRAVIDFLESLEDED